MNRVKIWLRAVRAPFFSASLVPVLVGAALAHRDGHFNFIGMLLAFIIVVSLHAGANMFNDYHDALGSDPINRNPTPFSGGSRLIQEGLLSRRSFLKAAFFAFTLALGLLACLTWQRGNPAILGIGLAGLLLGVSYSAKFSNGMGRGWGEIAVGLAFGPLPVLGSYLLQTNYWSWTAVLAGVPVGLLIMGVLVLNEFPDLAADATVGKRNWVVRLGLRKGVTIYLGIVVLAYLTVLAGVFMKVFPTQVLISNATIPLAVLIFLRLKVGQAQSFNLVSALSGNITLMNLTGLLLALGLWL